MLAVRPGERQVSSELAAVGVAKHSEPFGASVAVSRIGTIQLVAVAAPLEIGVVEDRIEDRVDVVSRNAKDVANTMLFEAPKNVLNYRLASQGLSIFLHLELMNLLNACILAGF